LALPLQVPVGSVQLAETLVYVPVVAAYPDQLFVRFARLARIGLDGSVQHLGHNTRRDLTIDSSGTLWAMCVRPELFCWLDPKQPATLHSRKKRPWPANKPARTSRHSRLPSLLEPIPGRRILSRMFLMRSVGHGRIERFNQ